MMVIVWDEPKRVANLAKHGIDFADIGEGFFLGALIRPGREPRLRAIGQWNDMTIAVIFSLLGTEGLSIISARPANRKERKLLE
jgi:hypothetical protein